jgi:hypothetical protein
VHPHADALGAAPRIERQRVGTRAGSGVNPGLIIEPLVSATPCAAALKVAKSARVANSATSMTASFFVECAKRGLPRGVWSHRLLASTSIPAALLTAALLFLPRPTL